MKRNRENARIEPTRVRIGHGANCSSVGSVIDTLFAVAVVGGALFAAVSAALAKEPVKVVGKNDQREEDA